MGKRTEETLLNFLKTAALFILLVAAGFYAYNLVHVEELEKAEREKIENKLLDLKTDDLVKINVRGGGDTFTMEKRGNVWLITSPIETQTDSSQLDQLLTGVAEGHILEKVAEMDDRSRFGLDPAEWEFEFYTSASGSPQKLSVGKLSPTGKVLYVTSSRHDSVVSIDSGFGYKVQKSIYFLREKRLFDADSGDIVKLEFLRGNHRIVVEKTESGQWELVEPYKTMADSEKIEKIIRKTVYIRAESFPKGSVSDEVTGLNNGEQIRLWQSGVEKPIVLSLGGKSAKGDQLWVRSSKKETIASIKAAFLTLVPADARDLREMRVVPVDDSFWEDLKEFTIKSGDKSVSIAKGEPGVWLALQPPSLKPDSAKIGELLSDLIGMKSFRFITGSKDSVQNADLEIELKSGAQKVFVAFARSSNKKVTTGSSNLHNEHFEILTSDFDILEARVSDLENRRLFPFKPKDVVSISIKSEGGNYSFVKEKTGWKNVAPSGKEPDGKKLDALARYMTSAEFIDQVKKSDEPAEAASLAVVTISAREAASERSLTILGYNKDKTYLTARMEGDEELLKISTTLMEVISSKELEELFR